MPSARSAQLSAVIYMKRRCLPIPNPPCVVVPVTSRVSRGAMRVLAASATPGPAPPGPRNAQSGVASRDAQGESEAETRRGAEGRSGRCCGLEIIWHQHLPHRLFSGPLSFHTWGVASITNTSKFHNRCARAEKPCTSEAKAGLTAHFANRNLDHIRQKQNRTAMTRRGFVRVHVLK